MSQQMTQRILSCATWHKCNLILATWRSLTSPQIIGRHARSSSSGFVAHCHNRVRSSRHDLQEHLGSERSSQASTSTAGLRPGHDARPVQPHTPLFLFVSRLLLDFRISTGASAESSLPFDTVSHARVPFCLAFTCRRKRTSPQGPDRGRQRLQRSRPRVPGPLPGSALREVEAVTCSVVLVRRETRSHFNMIREADKKYAQLVEAKGRRELSSPRWPRSCLRLEVIKHTWGESRASFVGASLRAPDTGRAGRVGNDVSLGRLLRSASAREARTQSVCHERHVGGVAATLGHDECDSAISARTPQHASFEIMTKQMLVPSVLVTLSRAQGKDTCRKKLRALMQ